MSNYDLFKELLIGSHSLRLLFQNQNPFIEFQDQLFNHVWLLAQQLPELSDCAYLKEFAEISNFLWKGSEFNFIDQIADYQNFYLQQVELEKKYPSDIFPYRLTDYKIFDVSVMHDPLLEDNQLVYFVYHTATALPYRVVCPFPYTFTSTLVHYQILPLQIEERKQDPRISTQE